MARATFRRCPQDIIGVDRPMIIEEWKMMGTRVWSRFARRHHSPAPNSIKARSSLPFMYGRKTVRIRPALQRRPRRADNAPPAIAFREWRQDQ